MHLEANELESEFNNTWKYCYILEYSELELK